MSEKNIQVVQAIYAAFGRGDVPGILEHLAEDLRHFGVLAEPDGAPWYLQITRKADVPLFFQALAREADFTRFEPGDFAANADTVYCTIHWEATLKATGKKLSEMVMHRFTFKNGRVIEWRGSEDTAKTLAALRR